MVGKPLRGAAFYWGVFRTIRQIQPGHCVNYARKDPIILHSMGIWQPRPLQRLAHR